MGPSDEGVEILRRPEFGIDRLIFPDRIVGAERTFAVHLADRIDRHQPHGIDTHRPQPLQPFGRGPERPFGGLLTQIHFIEYRPIAPRGMCSFTLHRFFSVFGPFFFPA